LFSASTSDTTNTYCSNTADLTGNQVIQNYARYAQQIGMDLNTFLKGMTYDNDFDNGIVFISIAYEIAHLFFD
jgi:hypothetical protein